MVCFNIWKYGLKLYQINIRMDLLIKVFLRLVSYKIFYICKDGRFFQRKQSVKDEVVHFGVYSVKHSQK